jgi:hypothetical protein
VKHPPAPVVGEERRLLNLDEVRRYAELAIA